jgi:hypothetical protein
MARDLARFTSRGGARPTLNTKGEMIGTSPADTQETHDYVWQNVDQMITICNTVKTRRKDNERETNGVDREMAPRYVYDERKISVRFPAMQRSMPRVSKNKHGSQAGPSGAWNGSRRRWKNCELCNLCSSPLERQGPLWGRVLEAQLPVPERGAAAQARSTQRRMLGSLLSQHQLTARVKACKLHCPVRSVRFFFDARRRTPPRCGTATLPLSASHRRPVLS